MIKSKRANYSLRHQPPGQCPQEIRGTQTRRITAHTKRTSPPAPRIPAGFVTRKTAMPRHAQIGHTWHKFALSGTFSEKPQGFYIGYKKRAQRPTGRE